MIEPMKKVIGLYREELKEEGMQETWGILNVEMDPVYEQLCKARGVMAQMVSEKDRSGWTIAVLAMLFAYARGIWFDRAR
jgi:hypothetical protein